MNDTNIWENFLHLLSVNEIRASLNWHCIEAPFDEGASMRSVSIKL